MFLATTALTEFWDKRQELLYLGLWCLPREKMSQWEGARGKVMPSPWDEAGRSDLLAHQCSEDTPERLVDFLGANLNEILGVSRSPRYWRILLRPWALSHVAMIADHWLHLDAAFRGSPRLDTLGLDAQDFVTPRDTGDQQYLLLQDSYHLQLYTELLTGMGRNIQTKRLAAGTEIDRRPRTPGGLRGAAREVLRGASRVLRNLQFPKTYFSGLGLDNKECWSLMKLSQGKLWPVGEAFPESLTFAPDPSRRRKLADFPAHDEMERLIARTLPGHFPTLFLEGYHRWHEYVLSRWPRAPVRLLVGRGLQANEYLKMLAAEGVERNGRVVVCQSGEATQDSTIGERHERSVADQYWTWGWTESPAAGAQLKALPDPRRCRPRAKPAGKNADEIVLVGTSLPRYPYTSGFERMPLWHNFYAYLKERERYAAALPQWAREALTLQLDAPDFGWGHKERMKARHPTMRFEAKRWQDRLSRIRLLVIDHPIHSPAEALALNVPTLLFWNPSLWKSRPAAKTALDALRLGGILHDDPVSAAAQTAFVLKDPAAWWRGENTQQARAEFCRRYAKSDPDWAKIWIKTAQEI